MLSEVTDVEACLDEKEEDRKHGPVPCGMDEHWRQQVPGPHVRKAHHDAERHELREVSGRQMSAGKQACAHSHKRRHVGWSPRLLNAGSIQCFTENIYHNDNNLWISFGSAQQMFRRRLTSADYYRCRCWHVLRERREQEPTEHGLLQQRRQHGGHGEEAQVCRCVDPDDPCHRINCAAAAASAARLLP